MRRIRIKLIKSVTWFVIGILAVSLAVSSRGFWRLFFPLHHQAILERYGQEYQVDPLLLAAVIRAESKYHPKARSRAGALGLMQIVPETGAWVAKKLGLNDFSTDKLLDPETNVRIGAWYLRDLLEEFNDDLTLALAAYNSGRGNVHSWLEERKGEVFTVDDIPFPETRLYVRKVIRNYHWYKWIYES